MSLEESIRIFIMNYGVVSVFLLVLLEYANFPLPSEVVLPLMGVVGALNGINFFEILIVSVVAGIIGSILNYFIGLYFGERTILYIEGKFPKTKKSIRASYNWLEKYDNLAVLLSRLIPVARTFISIVAGVVKMKPAPFILYSSIGITIWNALLISLGYIFGDNTEMISALLQKYSIIIVLIIAIVVIIKVVINKDKIKSYFK
ncbi:DedA family protein [Clostridium sp.]|uniref:DedA family protein n=1 Tax=Clostridium sp. TaxID=1506 RepID=UPI002FCC5E90